jgi:hypothetical protein
MLLKIALLAATLTGVETTKIYYAFDSKPLGRWTAGAYVGWEHPAPLIYAFDRHGQQIGNITVREPEASEVNIGRAVRAADGSYALAGYAYLNSGAAAFFWRISADGLQQKAFPTLAYIPQEITVAPDGHIWTAGVQKETARLSHENYAPHDIVHRYKADGTPAGSWLAYPELKTRDGGHPAQSSTLVAARDRVGWYPRYGNEYFEFSLDGKIIGRYPTVEAKGVTGFALCESGAAYLSRQISGAKGPERFEVFALDRQNRAWKPVANTPHTKWGMLYGCDGDQLVTWTRSEGPGVMPLDFWKPE